MMGHKVVLDVKRLFPHQCFCFTSEKMLRVEPDRLGITSSCLSVHGLFNFTVNITCYTSSNVFPTAILYRAIRSAAAGTAMDFDSMNAAQLKE